MPKSLFEQLVGNEPEDGGDRGPVVLSRSLFDRVKVALRKAEAGSVVRK